MNGGQTEWDLDCYPVHENFAATRGKKNRKGLTPFDHNLPDHKYPGQGVKDLAIKLNPTQK